MERAEQKKKYTYILSENSKIGDEGDRRKEEEKANIKKCSSKTSTLDYYISILIS